jgi:hypothetical protein
MRRREFITLLGGTAVWSFSVRAQQRDQMRRIGVLMALAADDPAGQARFVAYASLSNPWGTKPLLSARRSIFCSLV